MPRSQVLLLQQSLSLAHFVPEAIRVFHCIQHNSMSKCITRNNDDDDDDDDDDDGDDDDDDDNRNKSTQ